MNNESRAKIIYDELDFEYRRSVRALKDSIQEYISKGTPPDPSLRASRAFCYPSLRIEWAHGENLPRLDRSYARLSEYGVYETTITRPAQFQSYILEQLSHLIADFNLNVRLRTY
jgi:AMP nucleosidase